LTRRSTVLLLASFLFLLSGAAALVYQVIWQRILAIFSGLHIYSVTMIVTAFMAGLGFGSLLGGRLADRITRRSAVLIFGACELLIGLFALLSPWLYYDVAYHRLGFLIAYPMVLPLIHFVLLLFPTLLMGASLPMLSRGLVEGTSRAALVIGTLYGLNAAGAALGALVAVWLLIGNLGFVGTVRVAALLNFGAAAGALLVLRLMPNEQPDTGSRPLRPAASVDTDGAPPLGLRTWALVYALSGFIALSLEILWFRILDVIIKSSPFTFGHLLGLFLLFLGLGSLVGARLVGRSRRPDLVFLWGQWGVTLSAAAVLVVLCHYPPDVWPLQGIYEHWSTDAGLEMQQIRAGWGAFSGWPPPQVLIRTLQVYLLLPLGLLALPTFLMGLTYAYIQHTVQTAADEVGWRVGLIQTSNIVGSILGSLFTGALFLSLFGTATTLRLLVLAASLFGLMALARTRVRRPAAAVALVLVISLGLAAAVPDGERFWARFHGSDRSEVLVSEDSSAIVALQRLSEYTAVLRVNGTGHSMLPYGGTHTVMGTLPVLLHPAAQEILIIGLGAGNTAWAAAAAPELRRLDIYEIAAPEQQVLQRFGSTWFDFPPARQLLEDPRVELTLSDGRLALRGAERRYDVIEADALEPYMAYSGNLYSREFFQLAAASLKPGGVACSYTPTERTRRTFASVFPHVLHFHAHGVLSVMVGSNEPLDYDAAALLERLESPAFQSYYRAARMEQQVTREVRAFLELARVTAIGPEDRERFVRGDINTDLFPRDEFTGASVDD